MNKAFKNTTSLSIRKLTADEHFDDWIYAHLREKLNVDTYPCICDCIDFMPLIDANDIFIETELFNQMSRFQEIIVKGLLQEYCENVISHIEELFDEGYSLGTELDSNLQFPTSIADIFATVFLFDDGQYECVGVYFGPHITPKDLTRLAEQQAPDQASPHH